MEKVSMKGVTGMYVQTNPNPRPRAYGDFQLCAAATVVGGTIYAVKLGGKVAPFPVSLGQITTQGLEGSDRGLPLTGENCITTRPGVFAAGHVVHGPRTAVHAVEEAKRAAKAMMDYKEN